MKSVDYLPGRKLCALGPGFNLFTLENKRERGGEKRDRERERDGEREGYTYIEFSSTVKAILIGHHTERGTDGREEGWGGEMKESGESW